MTYVDGPAKSGSRYAEKYAEENLISSQCVVEPSRFAKSLSDLERKGPKVSGVAIVDDLAATGKSISGNIKAFIDKNDRVLKERNLTVVVILLLATKEAEQTIRRTMQEFVYKRADLRVCESLGSTHFAFGQECGIWESEEQMTLARALVKDIGLLLDRDQPLGFGNLALLVSFFDGCPNNSLPILHSSKSREWNALLPRAKN